MRQLAKALRFDHLLITPHSLRRGGATHLFRSGSSLGEIAETGYWSHVKTCRQYIDSALIDLTEGGDLATSLLRHAQRQLAALF